MSAEIEGRPRRIRVVGTTGAGKSTFAAALSERTGIPHVQLDGINWNDNWQLAPDEEVREQLDRIFAQPEWIVDGNDMLSRRGPSTLDRADLIVWLDPPRLVVLWRVFRRSLRRAITREELWGTNNRESFRLSFLSHDSVILWSMTSFAKRRARMLEESTRLDTPVVRVRSRRETRELLDRLSTQS